MTPSGQTSSQQSTLRPWHRRFWESWKFELGKCDVAQPPTRSRLVIVGSPAAPHTCQFFASPLSLLPVPKRYSADLDLLAACPPGCNLQVAVPPQADTN